MLNQTKEEVKTEIATCIEKLKQKDQQIQVDIQDLMFVPSIHISKDEKIIKIIREKCRTHFKKKIKNWNCWSLE